MEIARASSCEACAAARRLFADYFAEFHPDEQLDARDRARLADLQRTFGAPASAMLVASDAGREIGCGGFVPLSPHVAEVKRLFVIPNARRHGVATRLLREICVLAADLGYQLLRLDVLTSRVSAIELYQKLGWQRIDHWQGRTDLAAFECPLPSSAPPLQN